MKCLDQTRFDEKYGDCLRACIASIFDFPSVDFMPNFWEETQDSTEFWELVNAWMKKNLQYGAIVVNAENDKLFYLDHLLCIAIGNREDTHEEHAVVWRNGLVHDPHPNRKGLSSDPKTFVILVPLVPLITVLTSARSAGER